jgi:antitoxin (DNA-binding transcriptional repressor) of toxin-antitoxin stability system
MRPKMSPPYLAHKSGCLYIAGQSVREEYSMSPVTIGEAQTKLPEIIDKLAPGEELIITRNDQPVAKLVGQQPPTRKPRQPGSAKGKLIILAEDDEHLENFKEYMP